MISIFLLYNNKKIVVDFIKNADLDWDDFFYADDTQINLTNETHGNEKTDEDVLNLTNNIMDQIRLTSIYRGIPV